MQPSLLPSEFCILWLQALQMETSAPELGKHGDGGGGEAGEKGGQEGNTVGSRACSADWKSYQRSKVCNLKGFECFPELEPQSKKSVL